MVSGHYLVQLIYSTILCLIASGFKRHSPLVMWTKPEIPLDGLGSNIPFKNKMESTEFAVDVMPSLQDSNNIVVIMLDKLNSRDFKRKGADHQPLLKQLKKVLESSSSIYFPGVENLKMGLDRLQDTHLMTSIDAKSVEDVKASIKALSPADKNYILITVNDGDSSPEDYLSNYDNLVYEIQKQISNKKEFSNPVFLLSGAYSQESVKRERISRSLLATSELDAPQVPIVVSECCLMYFSNTSFVLSDGNNTLFDGPINEAPQTNFSCGPGVADVSLTYKVTQDFDLTISFLFNGQNTTGWKVANLTFDMAGTLNNQKISPTTISSMPDISVPRGSSYHCTSNANFTFRQKPGGLKGSIKFLDFQAQPFVKDKFGQPYDCVGFFSIPILQALLVTLILGSILAWGLMMLTNIHTMDQFDVPNSRPIVTSE